MLEKCANPECDARFRYLHEGQVYIYPKNQDSSEVTYFWLCGECYRALTLYCDPGEDNGGPVLRFRSREQPCVGETGMVSDGQGGERSSDDD